MCNATGYIEGDTFTEVRQHTSHQDMGDEIQHLQLLERCRKRAADEPSHFCGGFLRQRHILLEIQHSAADSVAFAEIESSMYKRRKIQLPKLSTDANDVAPRITGTRFEMCNGQ